MRNWIGKKSAAVLFLLGIAVYLFLNGFGLIKIRDRNVGSISLSPEIQERIKKECKAADPKRCAMYGMKLTCELLRFSTTCSKP